MRSFLTAIEPDGEWFHAVTWSFVRSELGAVPPRGPAIYPINYSSIQLTPFSKKIAFAFSAVLWFICYIIHVTQTFVYHPRSCYILTHGSDLPLQLLCLTSRRCVVSPVRTAEPAVGMQAFCNSRGGDLNPGSQGSKSNALTIYIYARARVYVYPCVETYINLPFKRYIAYNCNNVLTTREQDIIANPDWNVYLRIFLSKAYHCSTELVTLNGERKTREWAGLIITVFYGQISISKWVLISQGLDSCDWDKARLLSCSGLRNHGNNTSLI